MRAGDECARAARACRKTMSRGSSPTSSVRTNARRRRATSTTLTLSERWFTTSDSLSVACCDCDRLSPTGTTPAA
jgi:hypothetical protein